MAMYNKGTVFIDRVL